LEAALRGSAQIANARGPDVATEDNPPQGNQMHGKKPANGFLTDLLSQLEGAAPGLRPEAICYPCLVAVSKLIDPADLCCVLQTAPQLVIRGPILPEKVDSRLLTVQESCTGCPPSAAVSPSRGVHVRIRFNNQTSSRNAIVLTSPVGKSAFEIVPSRSMLSMTNRAASFSAMIR